MKVIKATIGFHKDVDMDKATFEVEDALKNLFEDLDMCEVTLELKAYEEIDTPSAHYSR